MTFQEVETKTNLQVLTEGKQNPAYEHISVQPSNLRLYGLSLCLSTSCSVRFKLVVSLPSVQTCRLGYVLIPGMVCEPPETCPASRERGQRTLKKQINIHFCCSSRTKTLQKLLRSRLAPGKAGFSSPSVRTCRLRWQF